MALCDNFPLKTLFFGTPCIDIIFRLTSIVSSNKTDQDTILKHVNSLRPEVKDVSAPSLIPSRFLADDKIQNNLNNLSSLLNVTEELDDIQNLSNATIDTGAEVFLYLNMHPSDIQYDFWFDFYNVDFFSEIYSGPEKLLTLLKIKNDGKSRDGEQIANKVMSKVSSEVGFQYFQSKMSLERVITEVEWTKNLSNVKGRKV